MKETIINELIFKGWDNPITATQGFLGCILIFFICFGALSLMARHGINPYDY